MGASNYKTVECDPAPEEVEAVCVEPDESEFGRSSSPASAARSIHFPALPASGNLLAYSQIDAETVSPAERSTCTQHQMYSIILVSKRKMIFQYRRVVTSMSNHCEKIQNEYQASHLVEQNLIHNAGALQLLQYPICFLQNTQIRVQLGIRIEYLVQNFRL